MVGPHEAGVELDAPDVPRTDRPAPSLRVDGHAQGGGPVGHFQLCEREPAAAPQRGGVHPAQGKLEGPRHFRVEVLVVEGLHAVVVDDAVPPVGLSWDLGNLHVAGVPLQLPPEAGDT